MEEVEQLVRKHKTFQKVLTAQDEQVIDSKRTWHGQKSGVTGGKGGRVQELWRVVNGGHRVIGAYPQVMLMYGGSL